MQKKLMRMKDVVEKTTETYMMQLGEEAVTHAKMNKGYKDHTANLKNSISFALYKDGIQIKQGVFVNDYHEYYYENGVKKKNPLTKDEVENQSVDNLLRFATEDGVVEPKGYTLILVAGMKYGYNVEKKGKNVLYLTGEWINEEILKYIEELPEQLTE